MATITKRKRANGTLAYQATVRRKGIGSALCKTFSKRRDALNWATQTETDLQRGTMAAGSLVHTVDEAFEIYDDQRISLLKAAESRRRHLKWWAKRIGELKIGNVTENEVQAGLRELENSERSAATVNRYRAALSAAFEFARRELKWIKDNPVALTAKRSEPRGRTRFLSDDERTRLLDAAKPFPELHLIILIALTTGARRGEITSLRWSNINLRQRTALIPDTKNGEPRILPISEMVAEYLEDMATRIGPFDWLFPSKLHPTEAAPFPEHVWRKVRVDAALDDFRFHDIRHTAASYLAQNGASTRQLADMLGHKTLAMVQRYSHLTVESRRELVDFLDRKVRG